MRKLLSARLLGVRQLLVELFDLLQIGCRWLPELFGGSSRVAAPAPRLLSRVFGGNWPLLCSESCSGAVPNTLDSSSAANMAATGAGAIGADASLPSLFCIEALAALCVFGIVLTLRRMLVAEVLLVIWAAIGRNAHG